MRNLVIMPAMAQNQSRFNLGEYAEEAAIIQDLSLIHILSDTDANILILGENGNGNDLALLQFAELHLSDITIRLYYHYACIVYRVKKAMNDVR